MAKGYSLDLRQKVWAAWQNGEGSHQALARRFAVSASFVRDLSRRHRESGSVAAKAHGGGRRTLATPKLLQRLAAQVKAHSDWTNAEHHARLRAAGFPLSLATVGRLLLRLGLTHKKRRSRMTRQAAGA